MDARRTAADASSDYEAKAALAKALTSINGMAQEEAHLWVEDCQEHGYLRGWLDARRAAREAMTDYEAKAALARILAEANGRDRLRQAVKNLGE